MNNICSLEERLDIIIAILNKNNMEKEMAQCPYCEPTDSDFNEVLHNNKSRELFFNNAETYKCSKCDKNFIYTYYYSNQFHQDKSGIISTNYSSNKMYNSSNEHHYSLGIERFNELKLEFGNSELINYLPEPLKESYTDALVVFESRASDRQKLATTRLIIEEYLRYTNGVDEADRIRLEINKIENKELKSALHKIVSEAILALHAKKELPTMNPNVALKTLELLFTLLYKLPKDYNKIQEEYRQKKEDVESQFSTILKDL